MEMMSKAKYMESDQTAIEMTIYTGLSGQNLVIDLWKWILPNWTSM